MTARLIFLLILAAAAYGLGMIPGHALGRRSRRHDYPNGFDAGYDAATIAERERWEDATGTTRDALARWQSRRAPEPGPEPSWPYGFHVDPALPATEVLLAEADTVLGKPPKAPGVPTVAEIDELAARYNAVHSRAPVVADLTGPDAWHYPGEDDVATVIGVPVPPPQHRRTGPEWLECQLAAQDSEAAAWMRGVEAEMASFRRGIGTRP